MSETNGHTMQLSPGDLSVFSALLSRASLAQRLGWTFNGDRQVHDILGYKKALHFLDFKARYYRGDIAQRIVKFWPEATWASPPIVHEDDADDVQTPFEQDWQALTQRLPLFATFKRADIQQRLGQFSVLFLGLAGQGRSLDQPARPVRGPQDLLYVEPYSEEWAQIERFDGNPDSPTFGQPLLYRINFGRNSGDVSRMAMPVGSSLVHASRLIHLAEDCLDDMVYGVPCLEAIYDRLDDLLKVVGGSAEMFWRDAKQRFALEMDPTAEFSATDEAALSDHVKEFMHGLRDFMRLRGLNVKPFPGTVESPKDHIAALIDLISATTGIPKRRLMGSEVGQLASTQDEQAEKQRTVQRQQQFAEPQVLRPFLDRCIALQVLRAPVQPYRVNWGNLLALSQEQRATVAQSTAGALDTYTRGLAASVVPPEEFRVQYLGLSAQTEFAQDDLDPEDEDV